jgi:class 3 adenylate cyclase
VVGDMVNLAARLEGEAPAGGVAIGPATVARLAGARTERLGTIAVKGKKEPVEVHRLVSVAAVNGPAAMTRAGDNEKGAQA